MQHAVLARTAALVCANDEEYQANAARLDANNNVRLAIRCIAQAAGGVRQLARLSASTDPDAVRDCRAHPQKCTRELQLSDQ